MRQIPSCRSLDGQSALQNSFCCFHNVARISSWKRHNTVLMVEGKTGLAVTSGQCWCSYTSGKMSHSAVEAYEQVAPGQCLNVLTDRLVAAYKHHLIPIERGKYFLSCFSVEAS